MGVGARPEAYTLADLALALTASAGVDAAADTAARAAARMVGDCAGVRLVQPDGGYGALTVHHIDPERARALVDAYGGPGDRSDEGYSATLRATQVPLPLPGPGGDSGIHACLLCPLVANSTYLGYLLFARTTGESIYTDDDVELARDIAGEVALALAAARSTERLLVFQERYRRILETTLEGVWQLDADGVITFANEAMATLLGRPHAELLGRPIEQFLDGRGRADLLGWLTQCREGHAGVHETRLVHADGSARRVQISVAPLPGYPGDVGGALCMVTDITDQVQARGLKRQLDHLRRLDSLGQLIGGIAHDFNNLLTVLSGSAEVIVSETPAGTEPNRLAAEIVQAAARGRTLAHQLLAFGRGGGRPETVAVPDLLDDVTQLLSRTLGEHIQLRIAAEPDVWPVRAERGPLEHVLINLAANARDAMPRGGVLTLHASNTTVEAGQVDDPMMAGRFVRLTVADTGAGMDHQTQERAFEAFFTTKPSAAGLGLATAASILRASGAHIRLDSQPRIGTTVTVYLPAADRPVAALPTAAAPAVTRVGHILVVEDQPELAELIRHLLQPTGCTVTVLTDPQAAIVAVPAIVHPDLLLTDVVMPGITGPELAAELRRHNPHLPVVFMSGYAPDLVDPQGAADPHSTLIQKPFNRETLLAAVRTVWT